MKVVVYLLLRQMDAIVDIFSCETEAIVKEWFDFKETANYFLYSL